MSYIVTARQVPPVDSEQGVMDRWIVRTSHGSEQWSVARLAASLGRWGAPERYICGCGRSSVGGADCVHIEAVQTAGLPKPPAAA